MSEREGAQRERGATTAGRPEGRGPHRREERAQREREGAQRERGATTPGRPAGQGPHRREQRAQREREGAQRERPQRERGQREREGSQRERAQRRVPSRLDIDGVLQDPATRIIVCCSRGAPLSC
jgi:hypothetical protein